MSNVGQPLNHTDGLLKVTGQVRYSAEPQVSRLVYTMLVRNTAPVGRVNRIDTHVVQAMPDALLMMTYENVSCLSNNGKPALGPPAGRAPLSLRDDQVYYNGQFVTLVVGDILEHVRTAARMVRVGAAQQAARLDFETVRTDTHSPGEVQGQPADTMCDDLIAGMA